MTNLPLVFNSIRTYRVNSMTNSGQCRLVTLIPCIQDSNPLYDSAVRLMFKLHANLPSDVLHGHRQRFNTIFQQLRNFYTQCGDLQYFVGLITVPTLPSNVPNFSSSNELGEYRAPVIVMPVEETIIDNDDDTESQMSEAAPVNDVQLIDTEPVETTQQSKDLEEIAYYTQLIKERDETIQNVQAELQQSRLN